MTPTRCGKGTGGGECPIGKGPEVLKGGADGSVGTRGLGNVQRSKLYGETDESVTLDPDKLERALETKKIGTNQLKKKKKCNSLNADDNDVTAKDMEAYRLDKNQGDNPMDQKKWKRYW
eukprot:CAMPEP_0171310354 /NCGR_PEP_ID=MMETSP0816-20121228/20531_1 /TAXON_ID=420281 /ORGANISM="Proboscia inermis, Strain CCAP1064/1" /LENGTH=118 /DNA_ID=CAMNT_0011794421 /DNA_START=226 /DNA_END=581 /DNA_ORIENTATION=+